MPLICEDLARYGVVLIPPSTDNYFKLLADIERRLQVRTKGAPPLEEGTLSRISGHDTRGSAILLNNSTVAIASLAYFWSFRTEEGGIVSHRFLPGTNPSVLLPFCLDDRIAKFESFWNTIFPGSKRLMSSDGHRYGDNTDVRSPREDELWHGGFFGASGGSRNDQIEAVRLTLDGVFFTDGGFAGANRLGVWEHTSFAAEAYLACARLAREAHERGTPPSAFFVQVNELTGYEDAAPPPPPGSPSGPPDLDLIRKREQWTVGELVTWTRKRLGDEGAIASIAVWSDVPAPRLHWL